MKNLNLLAIVLVVMLLVCMMPDVLWSQFEFGGYTFTDQSAFADQVFIVGNPAAGQALIPNTNISIETALTDINLGTWVSAGGQDGQADVLFVNNCIVNDPGPDFVVFEYGVADYYGVAVSVTGDANELTNFVNYSGTQAIDLDDFGVGAGARVSLLRIQPNKQPGPGMAELSADIQDIGALHSEPIVSLTDIFDFNDGTDQGWTLQGAYDESGNGPHSSAFAFGWQDAVSYPAAPGGDPLGDDHGAIYLATLGGHGITNPGKEWWIMQLHSPDLSGSDDWQSATGFTVKIADCMAVMTDVYANLYVVVWDEDQQKDRYYYNGAAAKLEHDVYGDATANWNHLQFDWSSISTFPSHYQIVEVFVNIWGKMNAYFEGGVYIDEVVPITNELPGTPLPPSDLQAHLLPDQIHLTWHDNSSNEDGFTLEYKTYPGVYPVTWHELATVGPNVTSYQMDVSGTNLTYHFRVNAFNSEGASDYSEPDTLAWGYSLDWLGIQSPNGGEVWAPNSVQNITWQNGTFSPPTHVTIHYSTDGGSNWHTPPVAENIANSHSYSWTVPNTPSTNCIIKVADADNGLPYDLSNHPFTIGTEEIPVLSVDKDTLDFGPDLNQQSLTITNAGAGDLSWNIPAPTVDWITSVSPQSGTNEAVINVQVDRELLQSDQDSGTLTIHSNGGNRNIVVLIEKEIVQLPEDWQFMENTGNNATVVLPESALPTIDGSPMESGAYVGVFTPDGLCCGYSQWNNQNMSITVWGDNSETGEVDGFQTGQLLSYRVYRPSDASEWTNVQVSYSQGSGNYAVNAFMILDQFTVLNAATISVNLSTCWNIFSINVNPPDPDFSTLCSAITDNLRIVKSSDGKTYIPEYAINDIGDIDFTQGYQAYVTDNTVLEVTGMSVDSSYPIPLPAGWSMISYLPNIAYDAALALASIEDELVIVKNNLGQTYIPEYGINDIGAMNTGQGYQIYLNDAATLVYPVLAAGNMVKKSPVKTNVYPQHFTFVSKTGDNATVVLPETAAPKYCDETPLDSGDEIGVFTSAGLCCGASVWENSNNAITVWGDDTQTDTLDGFVAGDTLYFRVWDMSGDMECPASVVYKDDAPPVYQSNALLVIDGLVADNTTSVETSKNTKLPESFYLYNSYPNPFNSLTTISFDIAEKARVDLNIYNMKGQIVTQLVNGVKSPGSYKVNWDSGSQPSGLYIIRMQVNGQTFTRKCTLLK